MNEQNEVERQFELLNLYAQQLDQRRQYLWKELENRQARIDKALRLSNHYDDDNLTEARALIQTMRDALSGPASPPAAETGGCECCATDEAQRYKRGQCTSREDGSQGCGHPYAWHCNSPSGPTAEPEWTPKVGEQVVGRLVIESADSYEEGGGWIGPYLGPGPTVCGGHDTANVGDPSGNSDGLIVWADTLRPAPTAGEGQR
jgi:hypothetical protein